VTAFAGGAVYFSYPHYSVVENSFFNYCRALNVTYATLAGSEIGTAGSIYYECGASDPACNLNITNSIF